MQNLQSAARPLFDLIQPAATLVLAREFLRSKGLPHSCGTWAEWFSQRVVPGLESGKLALSDLENLLAEVEEVGKQHVFLFKCSAADAKAILLPKRIASKLQEMRLETLLTNPLRILLPQVPTIVDVRWGACAFQGFNQTTLLIKRVETRVSYGKPVESKNTVTGVLTKTYPPILNRSVSVARLHESGLLEIRIPSQRTITAYTREVKAVQRAVAEIFPTASFFPLSLDILKDKVYKDWSLYTNVYRISAQKLASDFGTEMIVRGTIPGIDVMGDQAAKSGMASYFAQDGKNESSSLSFYIPGSEPIKHEVPVNFTETENEFAIPLACDVNEYEHILDQIRTLNA